MALKIGVTGGIGAGKSVVCKIFRFLGIPIYDADSKAKKLMIENPEIVKQIKSSFGNEAYLENGELNRNYLAERVFRDQKQVALLNNIVHPAVARDYINWAEGHQGAAYIINEAALMIESGSYKRLDKVITVDAPVELRIKRVMERDPQRDESQIRAIINKQLSETERQEVADYVIVNDDKQMVLPQVLKLHDTILALGSL